MPESLRCGSCSQHEEIARLNALVETQSALLVRFAYQRARLRAAVDRVADDWDEAAQREPEVKVSWAYLAYRLRSVTAKDRRVEDEGDVELLPAPNTRGRNRPRAGGSATCPHGVTAKGMPPTAAVAAIRALCEQCRQDERMSL